MKLWSVLVLSAAGFLWTAALAAAPAASTVQEVVVPGGPPPRITSSYPADGSKVPAGTLVLKVTFDQVMAADSWSYSRLLDAGFPDCLERPRLLGDHRTFALLCSVAAHQDYAIQINAPKDFAAASGRTAKPTILRFSTLDVGPRDIHDALIQAGLTDQDEPVMTWRDSGAGISESDGTPMHTAGDAPVPSPLNTPSAPVR